MHVCKICVRMSVHVYAFTHVCKICMYAKVGKLAPDQVQITRYTLYFYFYESFQKCTNCHPAQATYYLTTSKLTSSRIAHRRTTASVPPYTTLFIRRSSLNITCTVFFDISISENKIRTVNRLSVVINFCYHGRPNA